MLPLHHRNILKVDCSGVGPDSTGLQPVAITVSAHSPYWRLWGELHTRSCGCGTQPFYLATESYEGFLFTENIPKTHLLNLSAIVEDA